VKCKLDTRSATPPTLTLWVQHVRHHGQGCDRTATGRTDPRTFKLNAQWHHRPTLDLGPTDLPRDRPPRPLRPRKHGFPWEKKTAPKPYRACGVRAACGLNHAAPSAAILCLATLPHHRATNSAFRAKESQLCNEWRESNVFRRCDITVLTGFDRFHKKRADPVMNGIHYRHSVAFDIEMHLIPTKTVNIRPIRPYSGGHGPLC